MGLFRRTPSEPEARSIPIDQLVASNREYLGYSPVPVSVSNAVTNAACSAVIDTLATSVSTTPLDSVRYSGNRRVPVVPSPRLIDDPSAIVGQDEWLYQVVDSMCTDGNTFGEITTWSGSYPTTIETLDPALVIDRRLHEGKPSALVNGDRRLLYPYGDLWHCPGKFLHAGSPFAASPIDRARSTIGAAIAARDFGSRFFGDGGHPGAVLTWEGDLTDVQAQALKQKFLAATRGNREPFVGPKGLDYTPIMVDPNDSQFIDLMRFAVEEACRFWKVPPSMVYAAVSGESVTYSNVTQADLSYMKHSVEFYFNRLEKRLTKLLPRPQKVRFNRNAFLRSDPAGRSEVVDRRLKNKTMTINEARALEDEEPFGTEFDEPGIPGGEERDLSAAEAVQKVYLGVVNGVITPDEARELVNEAGGDLAIPGPFAPADPNKQEAAPNA